MMLVPDFPIRCLSQTSWLQAAARVGAELLSRLENLKRFPTMGREVARAPDPTAIRDAVFGNYVVRYSPRAEVLIVLRLWHHYEDRGNSA